MYQSIIISLQFYFNSYFLYINIHKYYTVWSFIISPNIEM